MVNETKLCKHCKTEIPKDAKVCPNCRKKQGGIVKWIVIAVLVIGIIGAAAGGGKDEESDSDVKSVAHQEVQDTANEKTLADAEPEGEPAEEDVAAEEEVDNVFQVGDIVELENVKITYLSAEEYVSDNQFMQPKDGNTYYKIGFEVENIGDTDAYVSSWDWTCYADGYAVEQAYFDDESLDATLSAGKKTKGYIFFEVPVDSEEITLEYETNFWTENKIVFVVK